MPEIAIKQILNDSQFRARLDENGQYLRSWGKAAVRDFERVRQAAADVAPPKPQWDEKTLSWKQTDASGAMWDQKSLSWKIDKEQYAWSAAMADAARGGRPPPAFGGGGSVFAGGGAGGEAGGGMASFQHQLAGVAGASGIPGLSRAVAVAFNPITLGITAATAAASAFAKSVATAAEESKRLAAQADRMGMSLGGFETLRVLSADAAPLVMQLNRALGEGLADPTSKAAGAVGELGLSIDAVTSSTPEEAFAAIGTALGNVKDKFERARLEVALFGRSGQELDQVVRKMAAGGMEEAAGLAVSAYDRARLAAAGQLIDVLGKKWSQFWTGIKADAAEAFGLVDGAKVDKLLKPPEAASAADKEAERVRKIRDEIEEISASAKTAREKFIERLSPSAEQLAAWDAATEKAKTFGRAVESARPAIERMEEDVRRMQAELEGTSAPNFSLEKFDAQRKYADADVPRLEKEIADAKGALEFAEIDRRRGKSSDGAVKLLEKEIAEKERQLADARNEQEARTGLKNIPAQQEALREQLAAQRAADAAAASWHDRLNAATTPANEVAAALIAGSQEFAGNLNQARKFIEEVTEAEKARRADDAADRFEDSMRDEFLARKGESSREAQLRHMVEAGGLDRDRAEWLAESLATLDAEDSMAGRRDRLAPNLSYGSQAAYDVMAQARAQAQQPDRQAQIQAETNRRLDAIKEWLGKIYNKSAAVAPNP